MNDTLKSYQPPPGQQFQPVGSSTKPDSHVSFGSNAQHQTGTSGMDKHSKTQSSSSTSASPAPAPSSSQSAQAPVSSSRSNLKRKCIDFHVPAVLDLSTRLYRKSSRSYHVHMDGMHLQPHSSYLRFLPTPLSTAACPVPGSVYCTQLAHVTRAKNSSPVMCLSWTPGGRRLLTGNQEGEFTLWDGVHFAFELIMSAHENSFRCMAWSHNHNYLLTSDAGGNIKYWSPSIAPVQSIDSHGGQPVHALDFSASDTKFVSCGDDATVRVWDWASRREERRLEGHGWDVKCVVWHPRSSVVASGSKDNLVKLWDPRSDGSEPLATLYGHKNTVTRVAWNDNGNWLLTASRDQLLKVYDIRAMRELCTLRGHHKEVTSVAWHPLYESVLASGGMDGTLLYWNLGVTGGPTARVPFAHDMAIWDMAWHPAGHCLATGSNDRQTKFWARTRPGRATDEDSERGPGGVGGGNILCDEMELGNHVGIVIGRRGATIIAMQRATGTKMHVDQVRRVLQIEGTQKQIDTVKKRVGALLDRVNETANAAAVPVHNTTSNLTSSGIQSSSASSSTHMQQSLPQQQPQLSLPKQSLKQQQQQLQTQNHGQQPQLQHSYYSPHPNSQQQQFPKL